MSETVNGLYKARGFLIALASIMADREVCGDQQRNSFLMNEARCVAIDISKGADYIKGIESEISELQEEVASLKRLANVEDIPGR